MIEQFITLATQQLGVSQQEAEEATSGLLTVLQQHAKGEDFSALLSQIGGAEALMNKYSAGTIDGGSEGNGLMGSLMGAMGQLMGGSQTANNLIGVAGLLSQIRLDSGQLGSLVNLFYGYIKEQAGETLADSLMGGLESFLKDDAA